MGLRDQFKKLGRRKPKVSNPSLPKEPGRNPEETKQARLEEMVGRGRDYIRDNLSGLTQSDEVISEIDELFGVINGRLNEQERVAMNSLPMVRAVLKNEIHAHQAGSYIAYRWQNSPKTKEKTPGEFLEQLKKIAAKISEKLREVNPEALLETKAEKKRYIDQLRSNLDCTDTIYDLFDLIDQVAQLDPNDPITSKLWKNRFLQEAYYSYNRDPKKTPRIAIEILVSAKGLAITNENFKEELESMYYEMKQALEEIRNDTSQPSQVDQEMAWHSPEPENPLGGTGIPVEAMPEAQAFQEAAERARAIAAATPAEVLAEIEGEARAAEPASEPSEELEATHIPDDTILKAGIRPEDLGLSEEEFKPLKELRARVDQMDPSTLWDKFTNEACREEIARLSESEKEEINKLTKLFLSEVIWLHFRHTKPHGQRSHKTEGYRPVTIIYPNQSNEAINRLNKETVEALDQSLVGFLDYPEYGQEYNEIRIFPHPNGQQFLLLAKLYTDGSYDDRRRITNPIIITIENGEIIEFLRDPSRNQQLFSHALRNAGVLANPNSAVYFDAAYNYRHQNLDILDLEKKTRRILGSHGGTEEEWQFQSANEMSARLHNLKRKNPNLHELKIEQTGAIDPSRFRYNNPFLRPSAGPAPTQATVDDTHVPGDAGTILRIDPPESEVEAESVSEADVEVTVGLAEEEAKKRGITIDQWKDLLAIASEVQGSDPANWIDDYFLFSEGRIITYLSRFPAKKIPDKLTVKGNLNMYNTELEAIGEEVIVKGNMDIALCEEIKELPSSLVVNGDLDISFCANLEIKGSKLTVFGEIKAINGDVETRIQSQTRIFAYEHNKARNKRLDQAQEHWGIRDDEMKALVALATKLYEGSEPEGLISWIEKNCEFKDELNMGRSRIIFKHGLIIGRETDELPFAFVVKGDLKISPNSGLKELPIGLRVKGDLDMSGWKNLTEIKHGLLVDGDLNLSSCSNLVNLEKLGDKLEVKGKIIIDNNVQKAVREAAELHNQRIDERTRNLPPTPPLASEPPPEPEEPIEKPEAAERISNEDWERILETGKIAYKSQGRPGRMKEWIEKWINKYCKFEDNGTIVMSGDIDAIRALKTPPSKLKLVGRSRTISNANWTKMPDIFEIDGSLTILNWNQLDQINGKIIVSGHLTIKGCDQLKEVNSTIKVGGKLIIAHCPTLNKINGNIIASNLAQLYKCLELESWNGTVETLYIALEKVPKLTKLPESTEAVEIKAKGFVTEKLKEEIKKHKKGIFNWKKSQKE